jgi:uncharacterized protein with ParB-like and HNH nuclease domain
MLIEQQIAAARKRVHRDGYDMSFGELASMYERGELVINPEYQRLFRWTPEKKTAFIESLLLNIPIPPIFVFTLGSGYWELVDGLQRVSTIFELMGILKNSEGNLRSKFVCGSSELLPDLAGRYWPSDGRSDHERVLGPSQQISIRRSRLRIEILDQQTDPEVKFELFQRLNTGGTNLSEQEVRNCIIASIDPDAHKKLEAMAAYSPFVKMTDVGAEREKRQYRLELVIRMIVLRHVVFGKDEDIHKYLDKGIVKILTDNKFDWEKEERTFRLTIDALYSADGIDSFRTNKRFSLGKFEFSSLGISKAIDQGKKIDATNVKSKLDAIAALPEAKKYSGGGVTGSTRLSKFVLPHAQAHFA